MSKRGINPLKEMLMFNEYKIIQCGSFHAVYVHKLTQGGKPSYRQPQFTERKNTTKKTLFSEGILNSKQEFTASQSVGEAIASLVF